MADHEPNRSTGMSPELLGAINAATTAAVREAIAGMGAMMAQTVKDLAITPEKLREANKPYVDPAIALRELREKLRWTEDENANRQNLRITQDNCPHLDDNGKTAINLVHNFFDRQPRGLCSKCADWIFPREWRIGAPTAEHPRGKAYMVEPHKNYNIVMQLQARQ
jgi:hypothetical protein